MFGILVIIAALSTGAFYTYCNPIYLPPEMVDMVKTVFITLKAFEGILPVDAVVNCVATTFALLVGFIIYKSLMGLVAMVSGGNQPDSDG